MVNWLIDYFPTLSVDVGKFAEPREIVCCLFLLLYYVPIIVIFTVLRLTLLYIIVSVCQGNNL